MLRFHKTTTELLFSSFSFSQHSEAIPSFIPLAVLVPPITATVFVQNADPIYPAVLPDCHPVVIWSLTLSENNPND